MSQSMVNGCIMSGVSTLLAGSPGGRAAACAPPAPAPAPGPGGRQEPRAAGSPPGLRARARRAASPVDMQCRYGRYCRYFKYYINM